MLVGLLGYYVVTLIRDARLVFCTPKSILKTTTAYGLCLLLYHMRTVGSEVDTKLQLQIAIIPLNKW